MGLMEAMTGYRKKDPYQEALVQLDKTNPGLRAARPRGG